MTDAPTALTPTVEDWNLAKHCTADARATDAADLVPGDAFTARGQVFNVTGWPHTQGRELVTVPVDQPGGDTEFLPGRMVPAWQQLSLNYGTTRCHGCSCQVGRDHVPDSDECRLLEHERTVSQSDPN